MAKKIEYEVRSNCSVAVLKDPDDAVNAIWLLSFYHGFEVNKSKAKSALDKHGFYEEFPLSIKRLIYG